MKKCTKCGEEKKIQDFPKRNKDAHLARCKICYNEESRERYNPEKEKERYLDKKKRYGNKILEQNKITTRKYREKHRIRLQAKWRSEYHNRKENGKIKKPDKAKKVEASTNWRKKNYEKYRAAHLLRQSVKNGKIERPKNCSICGKENKLEGHHFDYKLPLNVIWTCRSCHYILDRIRKQQEESMKNIY